jgi:hypothetical protein
VGYIKPEDCKMTEKFVWTLALTLTLSPEEKEQQPDATRGSAIALPVAAFCIFGVRGGRIERGIHNT